MTAAIIVTVSALLLAAYLFDLTSAKTRIPSVILLLLTGWILKQVVSFSSLKVPDLTPTLPVLGTIGLILIVLEGALELEINSSKKKIINKSLIVALLPMLGLAFALAYIYTLFGLSSFRDGLMNAIPLSIISSAIAIPSVVNLSESKREFITYESSLSDILGVMFFNFVALNYSYGWNTVAHFGAQLLIILVGSFIATILLAFMLNRIDHHIKFAPIIILIILIYGISKIFHLPGLIFILLFGLFMNNIVSIKQLKPLKRLEIHFELLNNEAESFKELTIEAAFLIRALFFLVFGFTIETSSLLNTETLFWAIGIIALILFFRALILKLMKFSLKPLLFIAPRGLITILLFLEIAPLNKINFVNKSLIIQVIVLSVIVMMIGNMIDAKQKKTEQDHNNQEKETNNFEHKIVVREDKIDLIASKDN